MTVGSFEGKTPRIGDGCWVHPSADVFGDVTVGARCWIGPGARLRGDYGTIVLGDCCAVEDNAVIHARPGETCTIGDWVTLGHGCVVHNVKLIGDYAVVGMNAVVSDWAEVGEWGVVAEGAVVRQRAVVPGARIAAGPGASPGPRGRRRLSRRLAPLQADLRGSLRPVPGRLRALKITTGREAPVRPARLRDVLLRHCPKPGISGLSTSPYTFMDSATLTSSSRVRSPVMTTSERSL